MMSSHRRCVWRYCAYSLLSCGAVVGIVIGSANAVAQPIMTFPGMPGTPVGQPFNLQSASGPRGITQYLFNYNGELVTIPATPKGPDYSPQSGFQLGISSDWPGQFGYRPMTFTLRTKTPTSQEQRITIRFNAGDYPSQGKSIVAEDTLVVPPGVASASMRMLVPQFQDWYLFGWQISVDGRADDFLSVKSASVGQFGPGSTNMGVLFAGTTAAQSTAYQMTLQTAYSGSAVSVTALALDELPTNWVEYSTVDIVVIPASEVAKLIEKQPSQAEGLLRWVRTGGNLWITQSQTQWAALVDASAAIDSFGIVAASGRSAAGESVEAADDKTPEEVLLAGGWRYPPNNERAGEPTEAALVLSGFDTGKTSTASEAKQFLVRGYGLGAIAAFRSGLGGTFNPMSGAMFSAMNQTLMQPRISWPTRHGNHPNNFNKDFNNLLIPGVGVAPVGMFQVLITLFVIGIGPLNYWLLRKQNKLPMLLFTVPAAAVATTALLFAYGMFADGFGVQTRSRTLTLLDQRSGEAASWGRLSYYAGISPRGGLTIPRDQVMYPMYPEWSMGYRSWAGSRLRTQLDVRWEESQRLASGWLPSRTPTQYEAITARATKNRLELRTTNEGLRVMNRLGTDVTHLAVEDRNGQVYWCENLAAGEGQVVPLGNRDEIATEIRRLFTDNLPEAPPGSDSGYTGANYDFIFSQSVMEGRMGAINSALVESWGPGKYIAFTEEPVELDLGIENADPEASFHVIEGTW